MSPVSATWLKVELEEATALAHALGGESGSRVAGGLSGLGGSAVVRAREAGLWFVASVMWPALRERS